MVKVKMMKRNPLDYVRETKDDIHKLPRNYDPAAHPFEAAREYQRAVNAVKLDRVFAKPFLGNLCGHGDGVSSLALHPSRLSLLASTSCDGELRLWDLATRKCLVKCTGKTSIQFFFTGLQINTDSTDNFFIISGTWDLIFLRLVTFFFRSKTFIRNSYFGPLIKLTYIFSWICVKWKISPFFCLSLNDSKIRDKSQL